VLERLDGFGPRVQRATDTGGVAFGYMFAARKRCARNTTRSSTRACS